MPVIPSLKVYQVTGVGTGSIAAMNTGGVTAIHVGAGAASPFDAIDWGSEQAGAWTAHPDNPPPICLLFEWTGNTVTGVGMSMYDTLADNTSVDLAAGDDTQKHIWRLNATQSYVDPLTITAASIEANWTELPTGTTRVLFDSIRPNPGNDNTPNLLVGHNSNTGTLATPGSGDRFYTNFFLYMAKKAGANAEPGLHTGWGPRITADYPLV